MQHLLKVIIIDDDATTIRHVESYVASAGFKPSVLRPASARPQDIGLLQPDIVLLKISPSTIDLALSLCRALTTTLPQCPVIMYGIAPDATLLQGAMAAGARRFLTVPFPREILLRAIAETRAQTPAITPEVTAPIPGPSLFSNPVAQQPARGRIVTVFSPKGGVGTTTLAVNVAVALQAKGLHTALIDANISCGNVEVFLNITPASSILQLVSSGQWGEARSVRTHLLEHRGSGVEVLLSPIQPEQSEMITAEHVRSILTLLQDQFTYIIVDTAASYEERVLVALELADTIIVPVAPDLAAVRNLVSFLRIARLLGHEDQKLRLVLMRANSVPTSHVKDIERFLGRTFDHHVISDGRRATQAINEGNPVVLRDRDSRLATDILTVVERLTAEPGGKNRPAEALRGLLRRGAALTSNNRGTGKANDNRTSERSPTNGTDEQSGEETGSTWPRPVISPH